MGKIGIIYGSTTGNTEAVAGKIQKELGSADLLAVNSEAILKMGEYDTILLGTSTWGYGDLQDEWEALESELKSQKLAGKKIGFFGTGDQDSYEDTFVDAMGILFELVSESGAEFIGSWSTEGYNFSESKSVKDGVFVGLALDVDNQDELTDERISKWVTLLKKQLA